jgi:hypothetical protein
MRKNPRKQTNNSYKPEFLYEASETPKASSAKALLQRELDVNYSEQILLQKRIQLMGEFINDLPTTDSQYSMVATAIRADRVEIDELQRRSALLLQKIESQES